MKHTALSALLATALFALPTACGGPKEDPSAALARLKAERARLDADIAAIEKNMDPAQAGNARTKTVGIQQLQPTPFRHFIDLQGKIEAENNVPVTTRMPGVLTRVLVKNGDLVRKGQLLAQVDDQVMQRSLAEMELQLQTATDLFTRQKGLWDQKIGTEVQYIQAKNAVEGLEKGIATMKEQMNQTRIYAPIAGTVDMVMLKVGQAISPGFPLCNVVNLGALKVVGQVPEAYAARVRTGDQVTVFLPDTKKEVATRVSYVSKSINELNRTFTVECKLPQGADYRANMIAVLKIMDYQNPKAMVVPINVIQVSESGEFVLVAEQTGEGQATVRRKAIRQSATYNGFAEIASGLSAGDWIISSGYQEVNDGDVVRIASN